MTQPSFGMNHCGTLDEEDGKIKEENINGAARKCQVSTRFESLAFISLFLSLSLSLFLDVVKCFIPSTANSIAIFTKELHLNPSYEGNQREGPLHRSQFKVSNDTYNY